MARDPVVEESHGPSVALVAYLEAGNPRELTAAVRAGFTERYGSEPTVIGGAPGRVNLIGEHTDYNNGLVLPVALAHATRAALRPRDDEQVRVASAQQDDAWEGSLTTLGPGSIEGWAGYAVGVIWALREAGRDVPGVDVFVDSRVPVGAGLSSSAALECAVGAALLEVLGSSLVEVLIDAAIRAETEVVGAPTGGMDQTVAVLGEDGAALLIDFSLRPVARRSRSTWPAAPSWSRTRASRTPSPTAATAPGVPTARRPSLLSGWAHCGTRPSRTSRPSPMTGSGDGPGTW